MLTDEFSFGSGPFLLSVAVAIPLIAVVAGCAICRKLCRDDEDEERRPLLTDSKRERSPRTERVENEHLTQHRRSSGEQPSPASTGNRVNVPCTVHSNEETQIQEEQPTTNAEGILIPDLLTADEHQHVAENLEKINPQHHPQDPDTDLLHRPPNVDEVHERTVILSSTDDSCTFKEIPTEQKTEAKEEALVTTTTSPEIATGPLSEADEEPNSSPLALVTDAERSSDGNKTVQKPDVSTETETTDTHAEATLQSTNEEASEEKTEIQESLTSPDAEQLSRVPDIADVSKQTLEESLLSDNTHKQDQAAAKDNTATEETTAICDKEEELKQELVSQEVLVDQTTIDLSTDEHTKTEDIPPSSLDTTEPEQEFVPDDDVASDSKDVQQQDKGQGSSSVEPEGTSVEIDFDVKPTFVKTIRTKSAKKDSKPIFGLTTLRSRIYIISEHSSDIEVYDSKSLEFTQQFHVEDLFDPIDIDSCKINRCIYVFDFKGDSNEIFKIDSEGILLLKWSTGQNGGFLSTVPGGIILLSSWERNVLIEYTPEGQEIREIKLPTAITELRLGIKLFNGNIVISNGEDEDADHRVCLLDETGSETASIGGLQGFSNEQFNSPNYLAVDQRSGFVLVADQNNKRVVLLSNKLEFKREIIEEADGLRYPVRLELDEDQGRLYVADNDYLLNDKVWRDGRFTVFDFRIRQQTAEL